MKHAKRKVGECFLALTNPPTQVYSDPTVDSSSFHTIASTIIHTNCATPKLMATMAPYATPISDTSLCRTQMTRPKA